MKAVSVESSYPGFSDGWVVYQGETPLNSSASQARQYKIETEIRSALFSCAFTTNIGVVFQIPTVVTTSTAGTKIVTFQVPPGSIVNYYVTGSTFKTSTNYELVDEGLTTWTHYYQMHRHNGISGQGLFLSDIEPDGQPYFADKRVAVDSTGTAFTYVDASQGASPPVFTKPALNSPDDSGEINPNSGDTTTFSWDAATNMTNADSYTVVFDAIIDPNNSFAVPLAGDVLSLVKNDIDFDGMSGEVFVWYVIATNTDGTDTTEARTIFISV